jgi:hypothetical protein
MSATHGGDTIGVARDGEPVVNRCADRPAPDWRLTRTVMTGDEQKDAVAACDRLLESAIDRVPRGVEGHSVQVEHPVRHG